MIKGADKVVYGAQPLLPPPRHLGSCLSLRLVSSCSSQLYDDDEDVEVKVMQWCAKTKRTT